MLQYAHQVKEFWVFEVLPSVMLKLDVVLDNKPTLLDILVSKPKSKRFSAS